MSPGARDFGAGAEGRLEERAGARVVFFSPRSRKNARLFAFSLPHSLSHTLTSSGLRVRLFFMLPERGKGREVRVRERKREREKKNRPVAPNLSTIPSNALRLVVSVTAPAALVRSNILCSWVRNRSGGRAATMAEEEVGVGGAVGGLSRTQV